jgi:uncharacterized membrane protein YgcG
MAASATTAVDVATIAGTRNSTRSSATTTRSTSASTSASTTIHKYVSSLWLVLAGAASCSCLFSIFGPTRYMLMEQQQQQQQQHHQHLFLQQRPSQQVVDLASGAHHLSPLATKTNNASVLEAAEDVVVVPVADLQHEHLFHATIKSCLPSMDTKKKCNEYVPPPAVDNTSNQNNIKKQPVQKVALLAPPGDLAHHIWNQMQVIMLQHNNLLVNSQQTTSQQQHAGGRGGGGGGGGGDAGGGSNDVYEMDIFQTSHVPPYGYGKTHGLTKIVRLVSHPVLLQVTNALHAMVMMDDGEQPDNEWLRVQEENDKDDDAAAVVVVVVSLMDLKIALRQVLRFHCRLSHVAAHTAILSLDMMDLLLHQSTTNVTNLALRNFLTPLDLQRTTLHKVTDDDIVELHMSDDDDDDAKENGNDPLGHHDLWDEQERVGTKMLSLVQASMLQNNDNGNDETTNIMTILDQVLIEEMQLTKNMTVWPCPSFWAAGDKKSAHDHHGDGGEHVLTPLTKRLARALSPDCNHDDPNNIDNNGVVMSCWVERDKCEAAGDAACQGNNNNNNKNNKKNPKQQQRQKAQP